MEKRIKTVKKEEKTIDLDLKDLDLNEKIRKLYSNYTLKELARIFNTSYVSIYNWIMGKKISKAKRREVTEIIKSLEKKTKTLSIKGLKGLDDFMKETVTPNKRKQKKTLA